MGSNLGTSIYDAPNSASWQNVGRLQVCGNHALLVLNVSIFLVDFHKLLRFSRLLLSVSIIFCKSIRFLMWKFREGEWTVSISHLGSVKWEMRRISTDSAMDRCPGCCLSWGRKIYIFPCCHWSEFCRPRVFLSVEIKGELSLASEIILAFC